MAYLDSSGVTQLTSAIKNLADASYPQQSAIADQYDSTATYAVGDYCIKDGLLYKCTTAISTAEAWNAGHWESTAVTDEFGDISGLPSGGTQGQVLTKNSSTDGDASWADGPSVMMVTFTRVSGTVYSSDKTISEVVAALNTGTTVIARDFTSGVQSDYYWFDSMSSNGDRVTFKRINITQTNSLEYNERVSISQSYINMYLTMNTLSSNCASSYYPNGAKSYYITVDYDAVDREAYYVSGSNLADIGEIFGYFEYGSDVNNSNVFLRYKSGLYTDGQADIYHLTKKYAVENNDVYTGYCVFQCVGDNNGSTVLKTFTISDQFDTYDEMQSATVSYTEAPIGGSGGLPSVTTTDNGKFLSVVNGEWTAIELQSASGVSF